MAKYGKTLAEVLVQINGTSQTKKVLEALTQTSKELGDKIKVARAELEKLAESGGGPAYDAKKKELAAMVKEQTQLNRAVNETKKFSQSVGDILNNISNNNVSVLNRTKRTLEALLNSITPNTKKAQNQIEQLQKAIQRVTDEIARRKGQLVDLDKVMANLGKATPKQLDAVEKRLQTLLESVTKNSNAWRKYDKQMRLLQEERSRRTTAQAQDIMGGNYTKTIEGTKQAIELLKKYQGTLNATDTTAINAVTASINKMNEELETAARKNAEKVMANPFRFSPEEINEAIKYTEKLQASVNDLDAYHKLQLQIEKAKKARDEFAENSKHEMMVSQFGQLEKLSVNALAEQKKYWEAMRDSGKYLDDPIKKLEEIAKLEKERLKEDADKVMGGDYTHTIEGTQQAIKLLEKYQGTLDATDTGAIDAVTESIKKMNAELETATRERSEKVMQNPTGFSPEQIDEAIKYTEKLQKATPDGKEWTEYAKQIAAAKEARDKFASDAKFEIMSEQFKQFDTLSKEAAEQQTKYWEGLAKSMADTDPRYQTVLDNIQKIKDSTKSQLEGEAFKVIGGDYTKTIEGTKQAIELLKKYQETLDATDADGINLVNEAIREMNTELETAAKKSARETLTTNLNAAGTEDIKKAVEWLTKYQGTLEPLSQEWREINKEIEAGNDRLKAVSDRTKLDAMTNQFRNLNKLSTSALADQQKYWQSVLDNAQKGTAAYIQAERKLQAINQETTARREAQAGAVMGDLANRSVAEIQEAVKLTEQLRDAQKAGSAEYEIYNNEIKQAKEYLQSYIDLNKQADMEDKWNNLTTLSANALAEQKKYWQEMVNGAKQGSQELQDYQDKLKSVIEEEQFRLDNKYIKVMNNPDQYSMRELEEAIKHFEKLRDEQRLSSGEWDYYASMVNRASEQLKAFKDGAKLDAMEKQFADLSNLSVNAFTEQKKYWQGLRDSLEATDPLYTKTIDNLRQIADLENSRIKTDATQAIFDVKFGNWDKTIEETQQAIKLIEEYKKQLKTKSDADAIDDANKVIAELNANLGKVKESLMSGQDAIAIGAQIKNNQFDGTTEDVLRAKKALEEYRKTLKLKTDASTIKTVDEALRNVTNAAEQANRKLIDINDVLNRLDTASVEELEAAAKQLQEQLEGAAREGRNYGETAAKLREVNLELKKAKKEWEGQENVIARTAKRLMAYVAVYGGFNFIKDKITEAIHANLELSDSFADIQKTTGLAAEEVKNLSRDIDAIDTRTSQQQLHELAATAGQIGLKSKEDVLGFVKASNMITVSLNELGSEGTASLMKLAQLTGDVTDKGVEGSLLAIGSAINELSANSAATAGPIVEFMKRMGGIAAQSSITTAEMAAIGATADAIGQSMEVTGTSMNKFVATLMSNSDQVAYALNMDAKALNDLLEGGKTMDAMLMVFERMNEMGGIEKLAPVMGDLGSEGARMTQMLSAMAKSVGFLRDQVDLSREAFEESISIENEYNIKNENAIALLERMGNTLREMWVNSTFVTGLTWVLKQMNDFVKWLAEGESGARLLKTAMIALGVSVSLASMHLDKFCKALFKAKTYTELFSGAWSKLGKLLKENWISLLVGALVSLAYYLYQTYTHVSALTRATQEYDAELDKENNIMRNLFKSAQNENLAKEKKAKLISEINDRYGKYLGFILSERDSVQELAAAYELANARMRESMATRISNKQMDILDETYGERMTENRTDLMTTLSKNVQSAGREKEIMSVIRKVTIENLDKEEKDIRELIAGRLKEIGVASVLADMGEVKDYIELQKEYYKEYETINQEAAEHLQQAQKDTAAANVKMMNEMFKQVQDLNSGAIKESAEGPFKTSLDIQRGIVQEGKQYIAFAEEQMKNMTEEQKIEVQKNIKLVETQIEAARKNLPEGDAWGKDANLKGWKETLDNLGTASVDSLVSTYKELRDAPKLISDVIKYNRMFGTSFTSLSEVMEDSKNKAEQIKNQLASMGRTTTGDFLWGKSGDRDQKAKARQDFQAAMSALEAFYKEYEDFVRQKRADGLITEEAMNRQLLDNTRKYNEDKQQLIKKFLGEENTFNQKQYKGILSGYDYFSDKDLDKMAEQYQRWGDAMTDGGRNQIAKAGVEISKAVNKEQEKIKAELLKGDLFATFENNFAEMLDELGALTSAKEDEINNILNDLARKSGSEQVWGLSDEERAQRIAVLTKFADQSYQLNADRLKSEMLLETNNALWVQRMNDEEMQLLLEKLRNYYDDRLDVTKKYQDKLEKEFKSYYQQIGKQGEYESQKKNLEGKKESREKLEGLGIKTDYSDMRNEITEGAKIEGSRLADEIDFQKERLKTLKEGSQERLAIETLIADKQLALNDILAQSQRDLTQVYMEEWNKRAEKWGEVGEIFGDFLGEQLALENQANKARARGDLETAKKIEQQQKENKQNLIKGLLNFIVDEAALWAKELALKMMFNAMSLADEKKTAIEEMTLKGKESMLSIFLNALTGQSEEAKKGLPGLITGAIVFAATMALQAMAKSAIANMFPEADTGSTGTRKLSTGMLTYAEGNYPVLGNDGKVYDAKYEGAGMKTGIYRGGAHFGIFSEKQPEMIVDGKTTQKLILNYPYIYDAITTIAKNGRLVNAMPTFASGDYPAGMKQIAPIATMDVSTGSNEQMERMSAALEQTQAVNNQLLKLLQGGIAAHLDGLETYRTQKRNERFLKRRGID